jgi:hypothetical protein
VDLWEDEFARLTRDPLEPIGYQNPVQTDDPGRLSRVVALAEEALPLDAIGSGAADELGLGPGFGPHTCLGALLQEMRRPGVFSPRLVAAGLRSPVIHNRNWAITALEHRPVEKWGPELIHLLSRAVAEEPRDDVRDRLRGLIGRSSDATGS